MEEWTQQQLDEYLAGHTRAYVYFYTPLCGTCQLAGRMLSVVSEVMPDLTIGKCNLNFMPQKALELEIESVPCLMIFKEGRVYKQIYAFESVPYLFEIMKEAAL